MDSFPYSAGAFHKLNKKKEANRTRTQLTKIADKSVIRFEIKNSSKEIIIYEICEEPWIDLVKTNDDGSVLLKNRASMKFDTLFALRILIPAVLEELRGGDTSTHVLENGTNLYFSTSRLTNINNFKSKRGSVTMLANIRHKYEKPDGSYTDGGTGVTFTPLELAEFLRMIPDVISTCQQLMMKPNTYYEGEEFRVMFSDHLEAFINIDTMTKFEVPSVSKDDCKGALIHHMKEMEAQREKKQAERNMTESLINVKQKNFMQCILVAIILKMLKQKSEKGELVVDENTGDEVLKELQKISSIDACSLYCKWGVKFQIPLYSSMEIFQSVFQNSECKANIVAKIIDASKLNEEEKIICSSIEIS